jgi:hypothetical protein
MTAFVVVNILVGLVAFVGGVAFWGRDVLHMSYFLLPRLLWQLVPAIVLLAFGAFFPRDELPPDEAFAWVSAVYNNEYLRATMMVLGVLGLAVWPFWARNEIKRYSMNELLGRDLASDYEKDNASTRRKDGKL